MKTLFLRVYKVYFDAIKKGIKDTEFREITEYWCSKLLDMSYYKDKDLEEIKEIITRDTATPHWQKYDRIVFSCGQETLTTQMKGVRVYRGQKYFAIKLGKILEIKKISKKT